MLYALEARFDFSLALNSKVSLLTITVLFNSI